MEKIQGMESALDPICDTLLHQQEYFKILLTLNTATLLITITFWEKIIRAPGWRFLILLPLASFALSLWGSLKEVRLFSAFHMVFVTVKLEYMNALSADDPAKEFKKKLEPNITTIKDAKKEISKYQRIAEYSYFFGLGSLLLIGVLSVVLKPEY